MKLKSFLYILLFAAGAGPATAEVRFASGTLPLVDGIYNSTQAVITGRQPVFSWEFLGTVSSFTVVVSSDAVFDASGEQWQYVGSTSSANTINYITRVAYAGADALQADTRYFWQVALHDGAGASVTATGEFTTVTSAVTLPEQKFDLAVDWNNPFNPVTGQVTRFRFAAKDRDRAVKLRVFTLTGELVCDWPEQTALKNAWYTETWDGRNSDGAIVARGIYLVNLADTGDNKGVTRKVLVVK
jgi:hypothetical protein